MILIRKIRETLLEIISENHNTNRTDGKAFEWVALVLELIIGYTWSGELSISGAGRGCQIPEPG